MAQNEHEGPRSFLLPIMAAAVAAGMVRMLIQKKRTEREAAARAGANTKKKQE